MERMKRIVSLILCLVMVIGLLPVGVLAADNNTHYLMFATDRHGNSDVISSILSQMESDGAVVEYVGLGGDMVSNGSYTTSGLLQEVNDGLTTDLTAEQVDVTKGSHDSGVNDDSDMFHSASEQLYTGDEYYVYGVVQTDMENASNAQTAAAAFQSWATGSDIDTSKVIIVLSHLPLHKFRNDNFGATYWDAALNAVADSNDDGVVDRDVIFFHGHNHSQDNGTNYFYKVGEGFTLQDTSSGESKSTTNYYTYATAGYLNDNKQATLVTITDTAFTLTRYDSSGNTTEVESVTRVASDSTGSTDTTDPTEGEDTTVEKTVYVLTDTMTVGKDYLIANGNTGTVTLLGQSGGSSITTNANVVTDGDYTYIETADSGYVWNATAHTNSSYSGYPRLINAETYAMYVNGGKLSFSNSLTNTEGAVYTRYWTYSNGQLACVSTNSNSTTYYLTYSSGFDMTSTVTDGIYIYEKQTINVSSDGTSSGGDSGNGSTDEEEGGSTDTAYGEGTYTTADDGSYQKVTFGTSGEQKTIYVLVDSITSGEEYLIVNTNSTGTGYGLGSTTGGDHAVTITSGTLTVNGTSGTYTYIEDNGDALEWTADGSNSSVEFVSGSYALGTSGSGSRRALSLSSNNAKSWVFADGDSLYYDGDNDYYLAYSGSSWGINSNNSGRNVYLYQKVEIDTSSEVTYSVTAEDIEHFFDADDTTPETKTIEPSVDSAISGGTYTYTVVSDESGIISGDIASDGTVTFTGIEGTATVKVAYTWTQNDVEYTIWDTITVTATEATYSVEITETVLDEDGNRSSGEVITETITIKGEEEIAAGYDLWAKVTYIEEIVVGAEDLSWSSSNEAIATVDENGNVTFNEKAEGSVQITVYYEYEEGKRVTDTVTFSVSQSTYFVPEDGTNDFPEYPNQGSIRIDKTSVALGNFSQTGIAQVELSMTGVPYGTSVPTDVVVMVDMTTSMTNSSSVDDAQAAIENMLKALVYDEENKKYDPNIYVQVWSFKSDDDGSDVPFVENLSRRNITSDEELSAAQNAITFSTTGNDGNGTCYNAATAKLYDIVDSCETDNVVAVFASDGEPTRYEYLTSEENDTHTSTTSTSGWFTDGVPDSDYKTEYYTYKLKSADIPVYTVGINIEAASEAGYILRSMSSEYDALGTTLAQTTTDYFFTATANTTTDELSAVFTSIAASIREAAINVVVEDKIADAYTMNFSLPDGVSADEAGMDDFYIQAVSYELDENNERLADPTVIEKFLFNSDGTITHTIGTTTCGDNCTHVTYTDGVVTAIDGTYFDYRRATDSEGKESEILTWNAEKLDRNELALQYFLYLDDSAGDVAADEQVAPGTYDTNAYAHITYTNHLGNECRQYFPVPSLTWKGAKVTYVFYLVNKDGQPVNRAGKVIPFAEAVYVTDPVSIDVTWNEIEGQENLLAENLMAYANVPEVYSLYDTSASYVIRVYETEDVDTVAKNGNYFQISGSDDKLIDSALDSDTTADNSTTKVFNTKAGVKYDKYGVYSIHAVGTELTTGDGNVITTVQAADIDYANTTVAFAVVWKPELTPDTVVIDYGLDVLIDVVTNDALASGVVGVMAEELENVEINKGTYTSSKVTSITSDDGMWTASVENLTSIRFSLDKTKGMQFSAPATFYYESDVNYYIYDSSNEATLKTDSMYSSVTVIPATTVYYEDEYVTLKTLTVDADDADGDGDTAEYIETSGWDTNSVAASATQDQDRPGKSKISAALDADNHYGYDSAYAEMSTYSMGNAASITVDATKRGEATFTFYGTGFDIIGLTSNTTGTLIVQVYNADGTAVRTSVVDTYYGYAYGDSDNDGDKEWYAVDSNSPNALCQVPVMKIFDLDYGQYTVKLTAGYNSSFDSTGDGEYTLYLDAVRIYDPTGNLNETANEAYDADGEGWPEYTELRDQIISKETFDSLGDSTVSGVVFIDGMASGSGNLDGDTGNDAVDADTVKEAISDYHSYGPNNELYLAYGQAVAADLTATAAVGDVASIQLAIKTVGGAGSIEVYGIDEAGNKIDCLAESISTATDMYYDITDLNGKTMVIRNTGDENSAIISLTNIKVTYTADQSADSDDSTASEVDGDETPDLLSVTYASASAAVMSLRTVEDEEGETEPEVSEPTGGEDEGEVPETSEPEVEEPETSNPEQEENETTEPEEADPEETQPEETEPENSESDVSGSFFRKIIKLIGGLLGRLFG